MSRLHTCTENTRPDAPEQGDILFETDTNRLILFYGGNWMTFGQTGTGSVSVTNISIDVGNTAELLSSGVTTFVGDFKFDRTPHITTLRIHYNEQYFFTYVNQLQSPFLDLYTPSIKTGRINVGVTALMPLDGSEYTQFAEHDITIASSVSLDSQGLYIYETSFAQEMFKHDLTRVDEHDYRLSNSQFRIHTIDDQQLTNVTRNYSLDSANGSNYVFSGDAAGTDPTLNVNIGDTLVFNNNTGGHPLAIKNSDDQIVATESNTTVTWSPVDTGTYTYYCVSHPNSMRGTINVTSNDFQSGDFIYTSDHVGVAGDARLKKSDISGKSVLSSIKPLSMYMGTIQNTVSSAYLYPYNGGAASGNVSNFSNGDPAGVFTSTVWFNLSSESTNVTRSIFGNSTHLGVMALSAQDQSGWYLSSKSTHFVDNFNDSPASGSPCLLQPDTWYNYTMVVSGENDSREVHHFLDGVRVNQSDVKINHYLGITYIGYRAYNVMNSFLDGYVTGMCSWNRALSETEITYVANNINMFDLTNKEYYTYWYHPGVIEPTNGKLYSSPDNGGTKYLTIRTYNPETAEDHDILAVNQESHPILSEEHPTK